VLMLHFILGVVIESHTSSLHSSGIQFPSYVKLLANIVNLMFVLLDRNEQLKLTFDDSPAFILQRCTRRCWGIGQP
jgi:hypothetical protein